MNDAKLRPISPIHPGEVLAEQLDELQMTADTALRLEPWLGVSAAFWLNLQKSYELDCAIVSIGPEIQRTVRRRPDDAVTPLAS